MGGMLPPQRGACGGGTDVRSSRRACSAPRLRMLAFWGKHATRLSPRSDGWHAPPQRGACGGGIDVRTSHRACSAPRLRMLAFWGKHATRLSRRNDGWHAPPSKRSMWRRWRRQNVSSRVFGAATSHACLLGQACHPVESPQRWVACSPLKGEHVAAVATSGRLAARVRRRDFACLPFGASMPPG